MFEVQLETYHKPLCLAPTVPAVVLPVPCVSAIGAGPPPHTHNSVRVGLSRAINLTLPSAAFFEKNQTFSAFDQVASKNAVRLFK